MDQFDDDVIILVSANIEWQATLNILKPETISNSPFGEWFRKDILVNGELLPIVFFHGGWGKISAAASTQFVVDMWDPVLIINIGTCGGFRGEVQRGTIILVQETLVYDIVEQMGDYEEHIEHYRTELDVSWLGSDYPISVKPSRMVSADRDILTTDIPWLKKSYSAIAGDWESGAIAYVAKRNHKKLLILRGVTDLVDGDGGEAYGKLDVFVSETEKIMDVLITSLPKWLEISNI